MPAVSIEEAVALSCNIDPGKLKRDPNGWMASRTLYLESDEFSKRLTIAERSTEPGGGLTGRWSAGELRLKLSRFASWARSLGWRMPAKMTKLASNEATAADEAKREAEAKAIENAATECAAEANMAEEVSLTAEAGRSSDAPVRSPRVAEKPLGETERVTLLKLVYGLAQIAFPFDGETLRRDRENRKSSVVSEIELELERLNLPRLSDDTIRRRLKEAVEVVRDRFEPSEPRD